MWNSKWEYENQAYPKERYEKKMSGELPYHPVRKNICKGCGREFYTDIASIPWLVDFFQRKTTG